MSHWNKTLWEDNKQHVIFIVLCIAIGGLLIWRCRYGLDLADESFYAATTHRFYLGDAMLIDEWWPTQLFSFVHLPFFALFRWLSGSMEGILLALRYQYVLFQLTVAVLCYVKLQKKGPYVMVPIALYLFSTPYSINAISYNTLGIGFLLLTVVFLSASEKPSALDYMASGIFLSCVILSNPFAVLLYGIYAAACIVNFILYRSMHIKVREQLRIKSLLFVTLGAFLIFCLFVLFILSRGTIEECINNLPYILSASGHEQSQSSTLMKVKSFFEFLMENYGYLIKGMAVILILTWIDRRREKHALFFFSLSAVLVAGYIIYYGFLWEHIPINYVLVPLAFLGFESFFLMKKKPMDILWFWLIPGIVYSLCVHLASNTGILAISASCIILSSAGMLVILMLAEEKKESASKTEYGILTVIALIVITLQLAASAYLRITYVWSDHPASIGQVTAQIQRGPARGIYTTLEKAEYYNTILEDMDTVTLTKEDKFLVLKFAPWLYLYTDVPYACPQTWEINVDDNTLFDYYALHPDKFPSVVYYINDSQGGMEEKLFIKMLLENGYTVQYLNKGALFQKP